MLVWQPPGMPRGEAIPVKGAYGRLRASKKVPMWASLNRHHSVRCSRAFRLAAGLTQEGLA